jgi:hypothetical protein
MSQKTIKSIQTFIQNEMAMADFDYAESKGKYLASIKEFDHHNNIVKEVGYRPDGWVENHYSNVFNEKNQRVEHSVFDEDDQLLETHRFDYDETGKIIGEACYYAEMDDSDYTHYVYDADGLLVEKNNMDSENELYSYIRLEYQDKKPVNERHYNDENRLEVEKVLTYDEKGQVVKEVDLDHVEGDKRTYIYEYDDQGERVKTLVYNKKDQLVMKTLVEYENGLRMKIEEEDQSGLSVFKFGYDAEKRMVLQEKFDHEEMIQGRWEYTYEGDLLKLVEMYVREEQSQDEEEVELVKRITTEHIYEFFE